MTWLLLALLVLSNLFWLLVVAGAGKRIAQLEQAAKDATELQARVVQALKGTEIAVVSLLTQIPTRWGH